ncbi:MAG: NYN domain-containing protein [Coleofasciculaceae cyanobacterium]
MMNSSFNLTNTSTPQRKLETNLKPQLPKNKRCLLEIAEQVSLVGAVVGTLVAAVSQQVFFSSVPLLSLTLMSQSNRRRFEMEQKLRHNQAATIVNIQQFANSLAQQLEQLEQIQHNQADTVVSIQESNHSLEHQVEELQTAITQLEQKPKKYLTRTHLSPINVKLREIQRRLKALSLREVGGLTQQVKELQQQMEKLDSSTEALHERGANWEQQPVIPTKHVNHRCPGKKLPYRGQHDRVAIFIDGSNLYHTASELGINIDYTQLLSVLNAKSKVCRAFFYTGVDSTNNLQKKFLSRMHHNGYQVISKEVIKRADGSKKANLDVELALDMVNLLNSYDTAVLVSGDGDFACAIQTLQSQGKRVEVASLGSSTSNTLIDVADSYLDLETIQDQIVQSSWSHQTSSSLVSFPHKQQKKVS